MFVFLRQRTLTQWIKAKSSTHFFQRACVCPLEPNCNYSELFECNDVFLFLRLTLLSSLCLFFRLIYFDVDPQTGAVYVKDQTLLDREARSLFLVTLQARDTENKPGTTVLEITLTDINDQRPIINRGSYLEFVEEGGELELQIEVTVREH